MIKVEGVTGHTVITEFCGDKVTRWVAMISLMVVVVEMTTIKMGERIITLGRCHLLDFEYVQGLVGTKLYLHFIKQQSSLSFDPYFQINLDFVWPRWPFNKNR